MQTPSAAKTLTKILAFHLPQFHPIPENDEWWGKGFTEWTNVTRGRSLFKGHYQPHLPADLGFYDLRLADARETQAKLAREAGLDGFIYYHYWFNGRRLLERPVNELVKLKEPDFPFCLCWANEPWSRNWDGQNKSVLMPQSYSESDDRAHINWLLDVFTDHRYIKIDGRPLFLVYRPSKLPDIKRTVELWNHAAAARGFPGLFLCAVRAFPEEFCDAATFGFDASIEFKPNGVDCGPTLHSDNPLDIGYRLHRVWDYDTLVTKSLSEWLPDYPIFPGVCPSWDNSVRRKRDGVIFRNATPEKYGKWLEDVLCRELFRQQQTSIVAINAWNEWAEGNHLEPCQRWGHAYLTATRQALQCANQLSSALTALGGNNLVKLNPDYRLTGNLEKRLIQNSELIVEGWTTEAENMAPPSALFFATQAGPNETYKLHQLVQKQRLARPDVSRTHAAKSLLSGWKGHCSLENTDPEKIQMLAFNIKTQSFAKVGQSTANS